MSENKDHIQKMLKKNKDGLLSCPFCGGEGYLDFDFKSQRTVFYIKCKGCRAQCGDFETEAEAITAWNTRSYSALLQIVREKTQAEIQVLIEKYGDPQYKTNEFALYDVIGFAQQLRCQLSDLLQSHKDLEAELAAEAWVSVEDRLPEEGRSVLCYGLDGSIFRASFVRVCDIGKPVFRSSETGHITRFPYESISLWKPITPPKKG